ncbi:hypothetical protein ES703_92465 [subsurface metagenome]
MAREHNLCIRRVHREHNSAIVVLSPEVKAAMDVKVGDHVLFVANTEDGIVKISKLVPGGKANGRSKKHSSRKYQRRQPRLTNRGRR